MINRRDIQILRQHGFINYEIRQFMEAETPDGETQYVNIDTKPWQAALRSRRTWVLQMRKRSWANERIVRCILDYYVRGTRRSPWDFIKIEYRPPRKLTDYEAKVKSRIQQRIQKWQETWQRRQTRGEQ